MKTKAPLLAVMLLALGLVLWSRQDRQAEYDAQADEIFGPSVEGNPAGDRDLLTRRVQRDIQRALPGHEVKITGELALSVALPEGDTEAQVFLTNLWDQCYAQSASCEVFISDHVRALVDNVERMGEGAGQPLKAEQVRAVLKTDEYIAEIDRRVAELPEMQAENAILRRSFGGDGSGLHVVLVVDLPESLSMMSAADAKTLGLTLEEAFALAVKNLHAMEIAAPSEAVRVAVAVGEGAPADAPQDAPEIWAIETQDSYGAARALLTNRWKRIAAGLPGPLVAAFPSRDVILYTSSSGDGESDKVSALEAFARKMSEGAPYALSGDLFTWAGEGWEAYQKPD